MSEDFYIKVQPFDWQKYDDQDETHILCWCLDEDSDPCLLRITNYFPHCWFELPEIIEGEAFLWDDQSVHIFILWLSKILKDHSPIKYELERRKSYYYYQKDRLRPFLKLYFKSDDAMRHCINLLKKPKNVSIWIDGKQKSIGENIRCSAFENDINTYIKLLSEKECGVSQWFEIKSNFVPNSLKISTLLKEYIVNYETLKPLTINKATYASILVFDIECYTPNHKQFPNKMRAKHDVYMISCIYQKIGKPETRKRYIITYCDIENITNCTIIKVKDEKECIISFTNLIDELNPDAISGFNILSFDWDYLHNRLSRKGIRWPRLGRLLNEKPPIDINSRIWSSSAYGDNTFLDIPMSGRINIDLLPIIRRDYKLDAYNLDSVSRKFLNRGKHDIKATEMFEIYKQQLVSVKESDDYMQSIKDMTRVALYCVEDSELVLDLMHKLNTWLSLTQLSTGVGVTIKDSYTRGQQIRIYNQLYIEASKRKYVLTKRSGNTKDYKGAYVFPPIPGMYKNIICLDFSSLYPSIILSHNICHTTYIPPEVDYDSDKCHEIVWNEDIVDKDGNKIGEKPYRYRFVKQEIMDGVLPAMLRKMLAQRKSIRVEQSKYEEGSFEWTLCEVGQLGRKLVANSGYGFLGTSDENGIMPFPEGAATVTAVGRIKIKVVEQFLVDKYGAKIIYGDTDSVFIDMNIKNHHECNDIGKLLEKEVTLLFPPPMAMEFEKAMYCILLIKKKNYAAIKIGKDKLNKDGTKSELYNQPDYIGGRLNRGIVLQRRDNCNFLRTMYDKCLMAIFKGAKIYEVVDIITKYVSWIYMGLVSEKEFVVTKSVKGNYKSDTCTMKILSERLKIEGKPPQPGDRLRYIVLNIPGETKVGKKIRILEELDEGDHNIDYDYYLNNTFSNPIQQMFQASFKEELKLLRENDIFYQPLNKRKKKIFVGDIITLISQMINDGLNISTLPYYFKQCYESVIKSPNPKSTNTKGILP